MKKLILSISLVALTSLIFAQKEQYYQAMGQSLPLFSTAKTGQDWQNIVNQFERIANVEKTEWLPLYYAGQATIYMAFSETDLTKVDAYLDAAQKYIDKAYAIVPDESEVHVLQGMLHQARINVDPVGRGMEYSLLASASFEKAKKINPENPRIYYLEAMSVFYTPEQFGGGKKNALPIFQQAKEKFDKFVPVSPISPNWGKENNQQQLDICQK